MNLSSSNLFRRSWSLGYRAVPLLFLVATSTATLLAQDWRWPELVRKDCGSGVEVTADEVFAGMIPPTPAVPASCSGAAKNLVQQLQAQDQQNWDTLSNRACAAKLGWVENVPGTCQAGGPPPICKANHWHQDPLAAAAAWKKYKQEQYAQQRQQQMSDAACGCWLNLAKQSPNAVSIGQSANPYTSTPAGPNPYSSGAVLPCSSDSECQVALPGSSCSSRKLCEFPSLIQKSIASGAQSAVRGLDSVDKKLVLDEAKEEILSQLPGEISGLITELGSNFAFRTGGSIVFGVFQAQNTETLLPSYKSSLQQLHDQLATLQSQYAELKRFDQGRSPLQPFARNNLVAQIQQTQAQVRTTMDNANSFLAGIEQQQELPTGSCTNVLDYQNSAIMATAAKFLNSGTFLNGNSQ